jgi:CubicO group peptidase (beta-lactamase class C family)
MRGWDVSSVDRVELDAALDRFWAAAEAGGLGIDAVHVVAGDGRPSERRRIDDIRRDVFSVSKTVTSLAVGMLAGEGALSLDDPVLVHLPELAGTAAAGSEAITVGHLLRMTAGNGYRWPDDDADHPGDPARDFLATPLVAEPGSAYHYSGGNTYVLSRVVHAVTGADLRDYLVPRLFAPLGIRNPSGCAARSASLSARSACSCEPPKSPGSDNCCCTRAPTAAVAWYRVTTSPG